MDNKYIITDIYSLASNLKIFSKRCGVFLPFIILEIFYWSSPEKERVENKWYLIIGV